MKKFATWSVVVMAAAILTNMGISVFADSPNYTRITAYSSATLGEVQTQPSYIEPLTNMHAFRAHLKYIVLQDGAQLGEVDIETPAGQSKYDSNVYYNSATTLFGSGQTIEVITDHITWVPDNTDYWPQEVRVTE